MFYSLTGTLVYKDTKRAAVSCGGVAYKCFISFATASALPKLGEEVMLFTHLAVREDALDLYGFTTERELATFELVTGVSGVGPKVGLAILSDISPDAFALAVATGDYKTITKAQGVGPKLAQRIVLELKDKVSSSVGELSEADGYAGVSGGTETADAIAALTSLGYTRSEAAQAIGKLDPSLSLEDKIKKGLALVARMGR